MNDGLLPERLASKLSLEKSRGRFSGAAGIIWNARTDAPKVLTLASGRADEAAGIENTPETRFPIGSLSKLFTATAVLRLWQRDAVPLDAPISSYMGAGGSEWADVVTLHHLLSHTSGLPGLFRNQPELRLFYRSLSQSLGSPAGGAAGESAPVSGEALWSAIQQLPLRAAPGSRFEYCNTGYMLAALIVERLLQKPFAQVVKEQVLTPLGLQDTAHQLDDTQGAQARVAAAPGPPALRRAVGHLAAAAAPRIHPSWLLGAGDLESTVSDLLAFSRGLDSDSLLGPAALQRLLLQPLELPSARHSTGPAPEPPIRGYGWRLWAPGGVTPSAAEPAPSSIAWHDGLLPGVLCTLHRPLSGDSAAVLLTNRLPGTQHERAAARSLRRLARELLHTVAAQPGESEPLAGEQAAVTLSGRSLLDALCGAYALGSVDTNQRLIICAQAGGGYHLRGEGAPPFSLIGMTQKVDADAAALRERACALLTLLEQGAASNRAQLRALCAEQLPDPDALHAMWQSLTGPDGLGALESFHVLQHEGSHLVVCRCHLAARHLDLHVHFDDDGRIAGYYLNPLGAAPAVCELPLLPEGPGCCLGDGYLAATPDLHLTLLQPQDGTEHEAQVLILRGDEENSVPRRAIRISY